MFTLLLMFLGTCGQTCKLAATLRIVSGRDWSYSLENPYTAEWQELAEIVSNEVSRILCDVMWVSGLKAFCIHSPYSFLGLGSA